MNEDTKRPSSSVEAFDAIAESYARRVEAKPHNAYYERPATCALLPEIRGRWVLDAGCGPGVYAELMANQGAQVVALDASEKMVQLAHARLGSRVQVIQADLRQPFTCFADASFDLVLSPLVLDCLKELLPVFKEFYRILRSGGHLVFSMGHPFADFFITHPEGNYFAIEAVQTTWTGFDRPVCVPFFRRPLGAIINPLLEAGFALERLVEPIPTEKFREQAPVDYADLIRRPGFLCIRAAKYRAMGLR